MTSDQLHPSFQTYIQENVQEPGFQVTGDKIFVHYDVWSFPTLLARYVDQYESILHIPDDERMHITAKYPVHLSGDKVKDGIVTYKIKRKYRELSPDGRSIIARKARKREPIHITDMSAKIPEMREYDNFIDLTLHATTEARLLRLASRLENFLEDMASVAFGQFRCRMLLLESEEIEELQHEPPIRRWVFKTLLTTSKVRILDVPLVNEIIFMVGTKLIEKPTVSPELERLFSSFWE